MNGEQGNFLTVKGGSPFGCGEGRLTDLLNDGVITDKAELRYDPSRTGLGQFEEGRRIGTSSTGKIRFTKEELTPEESEKQPDGIVAYVTHDRKKHRVVLAPEVAQLYKGERVASLKVVPLFKLEGTGIGIEGHLSPDYVTELERTSESILPNAQKMDSYHKELYLNILADTNENNTYPVRTAYALLNYFLTEVANEGESVIDTMSRSNGLDLLREAIDETVLPKKAAEIFIQSYKGVSSILGEEISRRILDGIIEDYNVDTAEVMRYTSGTGGIKLSIQTETTQ